MIPNYPCRECGHAQIVHITWARDVTSHYEYVKCTGCVTKDGFNIFDNSWSQYHQFIPDNLRYLEQLNDK